MNMNQDTRSMEDERLLDLLVDGELDDARRRDLLTRLDQTPGGWRSCALAFLEAQSWRDELGAVARERPASTPIKQPARAAGAWGSIPVNALAIAASFVIAFGLGAWYRSAEDDVNPTRVLSSVERGDEQPVSDVAPGDAALRQLLDEDGYMTLALGGVAEGESQQVRVPVRQGEFNPEMLEEPASLPRDLLAELERNGQTVRQQRSYLPVQLQDGRSIIVPMDEVEIVPVSRSFQ
jgi:hypothetical protein